MRVDRQTLGTYAPVEDSVQHAFKKKQKNNILDILHGAIGVNVLLSVMNPTVLNKFLFCGLFEIVFHVNVK